MTRRTSAMAKAFEGRWRIVEMDVWDNDDLDLAEPAHITFKGDHDGNFAFVAVTGQLDVRYGVRDGVVETLPGELGASAHPVTAKAKAAGAGEVKP